MTTFMFLFDIRVFVLGCVLILEVVFGELYVHQLIVRGCVQGWELACVTECV